MKGHVMALGQFVPNGTVKLLTSVSLDMNYRDTFYFENVNAQTEFFSLKARYTFNEFVPIRIPNAVSVPITADQCYNCSYMMFQNTNFNNKWFYAFITEVEWVSEHNCLIHYVIDDLQTWFFEMRIPPCFVEREHVNNDEIGRNIVPESLETGDYVIKNISRTTFFNDYDIIIASTVNEQAMPAFGAKYGGIYSGLTFLIFESASDANNYIEKVTAANKSNAIVAVFMMPSEFVAQAGTYTGVTKNVSKPKNNSSLANGYIPRNKKLFTYPYNFLYVTNLNGNSAEYRYEFFEIEQGTGVGDPLSNCRFVIGMDTTPNPSAYLVPVNYKTQPSSDGDVLNYNEKFTMDGFPQCAWASDAYKAWLAQNGSSNQLAVMSAAFSGVSGAVGSAMSGNVLGAVNSVVNSGFSIAQTLNQKKVASTMPPQAHGAASNSVLMSQQIKDFWFYQMTVDKEFARIIDDYFDMFGYAVHEVKTPNIKGRECWNYIKTNECKITGNLPSTAQRNIENMFNAGIRFWHGDYIGQYYRRNPIIQGA